MPIFDTGLINNENYPAPISVTVSVTNNGESNVLVGIKFYTMESLPGGGFGQTETFRVNLVKLGPQMGTSNSFTLSNSQVYFQTYGIQVITSGVSEDDVSMSVTENDSGDSVLNTYTGGDFTRSDNRLIAYVGSFSGVLKVLNLETNLYQTPPPASPTLLAIPAFTPSGSFVYFADNGANRVLVFNVKTNQQIASIPVGVDPIGVTMINSPPYVYVANQGSNSVSVINRNTNTVVDTIPVGSTPIGACALSTGTKVYITNQADNTVSVIDTASNTVIATIPVGANPDFAVATPDGNKVYVSNEDDGTLSVIDPSTDTVSGLPIPVGAAPTGIAVTPDSSRAYVTNQFDNTVSVVNTLTDEVLIPSIPVGLSPIIAAITPNGKQVYVTNNLGNSISVIDTQSNTVIATLPMETGPSGIAVSPIYLF